MNEFVVDPIDLVTFRGHRLVDFETALVGIEQSPCQPRNFMVIPRHTQAEGGLIYFITHRLEGWSDKGRFLIFSCTHGFAYTTSRALSKAELKKLLRHVLPFAHTIVTELLHFTANWATPIAPLVLDIYKPRR